MKNFKNRVAAITGAGSGIGRALATHLAAEGCHLALADIDADGLAETARLAKAAGPVTVTTTVLDVANRQAVFDWAAATVAEQGQVNLVFNNAGVALGASVEAGRIEDLEWLMNINFYGVVAGTQAFLPHLKASGEGHIINISSTSGLAAAPTQSAYNASKFAVRGYTEALRMELDLMDCGVSATCVHPGGIKTGIARSARLGDGAEALGMSTKNAADKFEKLFHTSPEQAAQAILTGVQRNKHRVLIGRDAKALDVLVRLLPTGHQKRVAKHYQQALK